MKKGIPLSKKAEFDLVLKDYPAVFNTTIVWLAILMASIFVSSIFMLPFKLKSLPILLVVGVIVVLLGIYSAINVYQKLKRGIIEQNEKDYALSIKIKEIINALDANPPDLKEISFPGLRAIENLKPVRIDYFPQQALEGELTGTFRGFGFFVLRGKFSGSVKGESTPELTDQNMVLICVKENGDSIRLICPSSRVIAKNLISYFNQLARDYNPGSYTFEAIKELGESQVEKVSKKLNPQKIYDYLVTKLELPVGQRPSISVRGIPLKENALLVSQISCEGKKPEAVIPFASIDKIRSLLQEKLEKSLPPVPLLGKAGE